MKSFAPLLPSFALLVPSSVSATGAMKPQTFDSNGVAIQYSVAGSGPPVVLIHGLFASAQFNWGVPGITKALATNNQVIALDARGHGGSGRPDQERDYGVEMAEDVVRLLDHLKIRKAHVIGYSMGGMITMKLMTLHPERVQSAVLGGMGWFREGSSLQDFWRRMPQRKRAAGTPSACIHSLGALAVTEAEVKAIHVPVAIVVGEQDPVRNLYVTPLQKARPDWHVTIVKGAGHINCIFRRDFKDALKTWLDRQTRSAFAASAH